MKEIAHDVERWREQGERVAVATVVATRLSAPRPVGSKFAVSDVEFRRPGPSYTVDTLEALRIPREELFLIVGSETFLDLLSWRSPRRVAELAQLAVVPRVGSAFDLESAAVRKVAHEIGHEPVVVRASSLPISASDLRRRVREGRSIAYRLPEAVGAYIRAKRLYHADGS